MEVNMQGNNQMQLHDRKLYKTYKARVPNSYNSNLECVITKCNITL